MTKRRREARLRELAGTFLHGGVPGLKPGDRLTSPAARGTVSLVALRAGQIGAEHPGESDRVYLTPHRNLARSFAAQHVALVAGRVQAVPGSVYRVRPEGPVEHDPDHEAGVSFTAASAVIAEVVEALVALPLSEIVRLSGRYMTWADNSPVYDADGFLLPSPEARAGGMTREDLRQFGRWRSLNIGPDGLYLP